MAVPIWKDYYSSLGSVASQYFRIRVSSTTIYQGKAVRAASSGTLYVRINDICADYIAKKPGGGALTFPVSFTVQKSSNGSSWTTVETVDFVDDWSYDTGYDGSTDGMAFPITGRIDLRQKVFQTRYATGSVTAAAKYGTTNRSITLSLVTSQAYNGAMGLSLVHAGKGYVELDGPTYKTYSSKTLTEVTIGAAKYTVVQGCPQYVLYYKNPFGGYDHLVLEGRCRKNRSGSRDTFVADYDNRYQNREEWTFQNEVTERYTLNTGFLTNEESARMPYLLDSPDVYLCDLAANAAVFIPVTIATDNYEVRMKRGADGMVNYTFEVAISQKQYKR